MLSAFDATKTLVVAWETSREEGDFSCPDCHEKVILHQGTIKIHHFQHHPNSFCERNHEGESEDHAVAKQGLYNALKECQNVTDLAVEKAFGTVRADVYCRINGVPVALEIQRSAIGPDQIRERTERYHELGIAVLWISLHQPDMELDEYDLRPWQKWCHAAYFRSLYFWEGGQQVSCCSIPFTGGIVSRYTITLAADFQEVVMPPWMGSRIYVPERTLWMDRDTLSRWQYFQKQRKLEAEAAAEAEKQRAAWAIIAAKQQEERQAKLLQQQAEEQAIRQRQQEQERQQREAEAAIRKAETEAERLRLLERQAQAEQERQERRALASQANRERYPDIANVVDELRRVFGDQVRVSKIIPLNELTEDA